MTKPLELVYTDVSDPILSKGSGGKRFVARFIDDMTLPKTVALPEEHE